MKSMCGFIFVIGYLHVKKDKLAVSVQSRTIEPGKKSQRKISPSFPTCEEGKRRGASKFVDQNF
jgi:hypothetical protein